MKQRKEVEKTDIVYKKFDEISKVVIAGKNDPAGLMTMHYKTRTNQSEVVAKRCDLAYLLQKYQQAGLAIPTAQESDYVNMGSVPNNTDGDLESYKYQLKTEYDAMQKQQAINEKEKTEKKEKQDSQDTTASNVKGAE